MRKDPGSTCKRGAVGGGVGEESPGACAPGSHACDDGVIGTGCASARVRRASAALLGVVSGKNRRELALPVLMSERIGDSLSAAVVPRTEEGDHVVAVDTAGVIPVGGAAGLVAIIAVDKIERRLVIWITAIVD